MQDETVFTKGKLMERYDLSVSQLSLRTKHLGIELAKLDDGRSYATEEQVRRLDNLHEFLNAGDKKRLMREYVEPQEVEVMSGVSIPTEAKYGMQGNLFEEFANAVIKIQEASLFPEERAVAGVEVLLKLVDNQCLVTSSQVHKLIGIKPKGKVFVRGSFTFIRQGKIGIQSGWLVTRTKLKLIGVDE
jgi:hypothetical protein